MRDYWTTIQQGIKRFWRPGDAVHCIGMFRRPGETCELCGKTDITWNYLLRNIRSQATLRVGSECVQNYRKAIEETGEECPIAFLPKHIHVAERLNEESPGSARIYVGELDLASGDLDDTRDYVDPSDYDPDDDVPEGLGADEIDWDAWDGEWEP